MRRRGRVEPSYYFMWGMTIVGLVDDVPLIRRCMWCVGWNFRVWEQHSTQPVFMDTLLMDRGMTKCVCEELPQKQSNLLVAHKTKQYVQ